MSRAKSRKGPLARPGAQAILGLTLMTYSSWIGRKIEREPKPDAYVLLFEDDVDYSVIATKMLTRLPDEHRVQTATTLAQALEVMNISSPTCIVADLGLTDLDGLEVVKSLLEAAPDIPLVVLTAPTQEEIAVKAMRLGAQDYIVKDRVTPELLQRSLRYAIERKKLERELSHQSLHDPLTGLPNRTLFLDRLEVARARLARHNDGLAIIFLDLDNFKVVNDTLGHDVGDELLVAVSERLKTLMRSEDTVARSGGDEFCLLCEDVPGPDLAKTISGRVEAAFSEPFVVGGREVYVTASVGVVQVDDPSMPTGNLISDADAAMYKAKELGRNRTELFQPSFHEELVERMELEHGLRRTLQEGGFLLDFQPIMDLRTHRIACLEALVRWQHPERGLLQPTAFVDLAEETGLIVPLGEWVIDQAFAQAAVWLADSGAPDVQISVNVSPRQIEDGGFVNLVESALLRSELPPRNVILELTESTLMQLSPKSSNKLQSLKELGIKVALDDFGTGYSSLSYLQEFPVDIVKVDRSFVRDIGDSPERLAFARAIVTFSSTLNMQTIAEGIEEAGQVTCLQDMDCPLGQGFLLARPMSGDEVLSLLRGRPHVLRTSA